MTTAQAKSGVRLRRPDRLPARVKVSSALTMPELADHSEDIRVFATSMLERLTREASVEMSEAVGMYMGLANDCSELSAQLRSASVEPKRSWSGLDEDDVAKMKDDYARTLSLGLTQLRLVLEYAKDNPVIDKRGAPEYWATTGLRILLAKIRMTVKHWGMALAWEHKYLKVPSGTPEATAERLLEQYHLRETPHV